MGTNTTNYGLIKPSENDYYNIEDFNNNSDIIDNEIKKVNDRVGAVEGRATTLEDRATNVEARATTLEDRATNVENRADVLEDYIYNPNLLINGNFDIWQRGESFNITGGAKICDMFHIAIKGSVETIERDFSDVPNSFSNSCLKITTGQINSAIIIRYNIKASELGIPIGETLTYSFYAKVPSGMMFTTTIKDSQHKFFVGTGEWTKYEANFVVNDDNIYFIDIFRIQQLEFNNDVIKIAQCKLEVGDKATPFEKMNFADELNKCRRYYYNPAYMCVINQMHYGIGMCMLTTHARIIINCPVQMRTIPTIITSGDLVLLKAGGGIEPVTSMQIMANATSKDIITLKADVAGNLNPTDATLLVKNNNIDAYIAFDASL